MVSQQVLRAYRVAVDPTVSQLEALKSHAGASRSAFNYHLAARMAAHRLWRQLAAEATFARTEAGVGDP